MLHINDPIIRDLLLRGNFGLEKESLRVLPDGNIAHTRHPFPSHDNITRDFCENQTEINTGIFTTAAEAIAELNHYTRILQEALSQFRTPEYLWPFSNPPYLKSEDDIPIAVFDGSRASKTTYREYLSAKYGRYKMTLSGIHINYSANDTVLEREYENLLADAKRDPSIAVPPSLTEFKNKFYVELAEKAAAYGWILTALTAASPIADGSYIDAHLTGQDYDAGMNSLRCSELGYWNYFTPILDYSDVRHYADSIQQYVDNGLLSSPTELYYPIRLKPKGLNSLETLRGNGVSHIELRMVDLNPLVKSGLDVRDVQFTELLLMYLASLPALHLTANQQVQATANFKIAAHANLEAAKIILPDGLSYSVQNAGIQILAHMKTFYAGILQGERQTNVISILDFEMKKLTDERARYASKVKELYSGDFVRKGTALAQQRQQEFLEK